MNKNTSFKRHSKEMLKDMARIDLNGLRRILYESFESDRVVPHFRIEKDVLDLLEILDYKKDQLFFSPFARIKLDFEWTDKITGQIFKDMYLSQTEEGLTVYCLRIFPSEGTVDIFPVEMDFKLNMKGCQPSDKSDFVVKDSKGNEYKKDSAIEHFFDGNVRDYDEYVKDNSRAEERAMAIVGNFLNYINSNSGEIEYINNSVKKNYVRNKLKAGKIPSLLIYNIKLKEKYRRYFNSQKEKYGDSFNFRFWVRGHWMTFNHPRYKNKQGQKTWVLPYIKGKGELIKKDYYVGEKEQCWENEKQMIRVIRELFPSKEIKTHDRTTLNGLEIDCYIPELKLGFEYNGLQHYEHVEIFHKTKEDFEAQKQRDVEKLRRAKEKGIKIITIRYDELVTKEVIEGKLK